MINLPPEILLIIARQNSAAGRALHLADPTLSGLSTPEQRLAWYHRRDRRGRTWIEAPDRCLQHDYADPTDPYVTVIRPPKKVIYRKFGRKHRDGDMPAIFEPNSRTWCQDGRKHRDHDQPAVLYFGTDGAMWSWYHHGMRHRDNDMPAEIDTIHHIRQWFYNNTCHRDNDQPAYMCDNGKREWYKNGERHRETGPALIYYNGSFDYCLFDRILNIDSDEILQQLVSTVNDPRLKPFAEEIIKHWAADESDDSGYSIESDD